MVLEALMELMIGVFGIVHRPRVTIKFLTSFPVVHGVDSAGIFVLI